MRTSRNGWRVLAVVAMAVISGCSSSTSVSRSNSPISASPSVPADADGRLQQSVVLQQGQLVIDLAPAGHPPAISADQAAAADPNRGQYRGHTPTVVYGLVTTPGSGKGRPGGGIDPQVDHQLDWIVWYRNVDIPGAGGAACADEPCPTSNGPEIGDAITILDGQTGQALIGMFGRES